MDTLLKPQPWYIRHKYYLLCGAALLAFLGYVASIAFGPSRQRIDQETVRIGEAKREAFREYVDVEGLVQPIRTLKINTREAGTVLRIVAEEGQTLQQGDTILVLTNPDLERAIEDQRDELARQQTSYEQQLIEQEKLRLSLKKQSLQTQYEMSRLEKNIGLDREEHQMGIKSRAQLEVAEEEYKYQQQRTQLEMLSLRNDSASAVLRSQLMARDMERERKKYRHTEERLAELVVLAPCEGQLSYISATDGQRVGAGEMIAEIKVLTDFKLHASLNEYYIDRITSGLPAGVKYQGESYPLRITKVVPEVKNRSFDIDLVFDAERPENIRVGKSYRVQIELGKPEEAITIPRGDFYQYTSGRWIYVLDKSGKQATKTNISIGRQNPSQYEILEGLQPGDQVITTGYENFGEAEVIVLK